jgi:hypothetical protein
MSVDPDEVTSGMKEFEFVLERMKSDWSDRRERVQEALKRWAEDQGEGGNRLLYERLCGWADIVLLRQFLLRAEAGSYSHLSSRIVDDEVFWGTDVRDLFGSELVTSREIVYRIVLDTIFKPVLPGRGDLGDDRRPDQRPDRRRKAEPDSDRTGHAQRNGGLNFRKLLTPAIVALSIGAIGAFIIGVFVPLGAWRRALSDRMLWSLALYFLAIFAAFFLYVCTTTLVRIEAKRKGKVSARWLYVQWVLISGVIGIFAGGLYNPGEDSNYTSRAVHRAANALTVFAVFLVMGLIGTAVGLGKLEKAKPAALKPEQGSEGTELAK